MGYDSKVYVVEKSDMKGIEQQGTENRYYAKIIASYDMCKFGAFDGIFKGKESDCYIYADDGNTVITKDCYGDNITELPLNDVIVYLEKYQEEQEHYRRVAPLLGLLKGFDPDEWKNIVVLHYGH